MSSLSLFDQAKTIDAICIMILFLCICSVYHFVYQDPLNPKQQKYQVNEINFNETVDVKELKWKLLAVNFAQNISNLDNFLPVDADTPVLLVQVHKDIQRLHILVSSLVEVRDIQNTMLIFSHSYYHESINNLIDSIDFCKVMRIYYPYSLQLNPHKFPGVDTDDCVPGIKVNDNCAARDARLTENKQHWWWTANFIFNKMKWSQKLKSVIFLEEYNYVAPDLIHMLEYTQKTIEYFPHVEVVSFGRPLTKTLDMNLMLLEPWRPPFDVGLSFNKSTWTKIVSLAVHYCMYNDHSWSYSLFNLFKHFPNGHANMIACMTPRVLSTKELVRVNQKSMQKKFTKPYRMSKLFPEKVSVTYLFGRNGIVERDVQAPREGIGGWNDLRDQVLCLDPLFSTTTEEKRYYDQI